MAVIKIACEIAIWIPGEKKTKTKTIFSPTNHERKD